jgi:hypothetical protein
MIFTNHIWYAANRKGRLEALFSRSEWDKNRDYVEALAAAVPKWF